MYICVPISTTMKKENKSTSKKRPVLGRGLGALLDSTNQKVRLPSDVANTQDIELSLIGTNPYQPRTIFEEESLQELADSIKQHGLIQPITVRKVGATYQIISGERRFRACSMVNLTKLPAYVRTADNEQMLSFALIENIQRQDLNAIELAISYQRLISECNLKQEEVADRLSKKRSTITNYLRLLKLPDAIQKAIKEKQITTGHAKALSSVENIDQQLFIFQKTIQKSLSVRQVEQLVQSLKTPKPNIAEKQEQKMSEEYLDLQGKLSSHFGTKIQIQAKGKSKGNIQIPFQSTEELERILELMEVNLF